MQLQLTFIKNTEGKKQLVRHFVQFSTFPGSFLNQGNFGYHLELQLNKFFKFSNDLLYTERFFSLSVIYVFF